MKGDEALALKYLKEVADSDPNLPLTKEYLERISRDIISGKLK